MKDTRTRDEKIRDLAANSGATDAERNAAKSFLQKSTPDKILEPAPTVAQPHFTKVEQWVQQQAAAQHQQRKMALAVQRRINEEMRRKMYGRVVNVPHFVEKGPDYSGFIVVILVVVFLLGSGC
jgi:quinol monooxygenase YgiN